MELFMVSFFKEGVMTKKLLLVLLGAELLLAPGVEAQTKTGSIQGVWQVVEVTMPGSTPATITIPEPRPNLTIITAKHYSRVQVEAEGPRPAIADVAKASADQLRATWGPFVGEAGTYEIKGNVITMRPIAAKNPAAMMHGAFTTWSFKLTGDTLLVTAEGNQNGPISNPVTVKAVRVE
jgi:hypothetical protein